MTAVPTRMAAAWRQRTRREQAYLAVMAVCVAAFAYWFALVAPLRAMAADAERRHVAALVQQARLPSVLEALARHQRPAAAAIDAEALIRSAASAGVRLTPAATSGPGRLPLQFEAVPADALFAWLAQLRDGQGLAPVKANIQRGPSGVRGELVFAAAGP